MSGNSNVPQVLPSQSTTSDINTWKDHGGTPLHIAIIHDDLETLKNLLNHPQIDVNQKSYRDGTPLLMALCKFRSDTFITHLIEAGCDPNFSDSLGQSPLHLAMLRSSVDVAKQLIERGANINAVCDDYFTPLHYAVENDSVEGVCMLLYFGVDVTILNHENMTPFAYVVLYRNMDNIARVLFDHYDDFSYANSNGYTALHLAGVSGSPLAIDLVKAGADVNCLTDYGQSALHFSLKYVDCELFKLIWSKIDHEILLCGKEPFLLTYLQTMSFASLKDYLECLYLLLKCPKAFDLVEQLIVHNSFQELLSSLHKLNVELCDRLAIINICLSYGFKANIQDVNLAFKLFGYGEELEAFIYSFNCDQKFTSEDLVSPLLGFILGMEEPSTINTSELQNRLLESNKKSITIYIHNAFKYFSLHLHQKMHWSNFIKSAPEEYHDYILELPTLSEFPSLLELSRNKTYAFIMQTYDIKRPYEFHDVVKNLKLPLFIENVIRFKTPIY